MKKLIKNTLAMKKFINIEKSEYNNAIGKIDRLRFYSKGFLSSNVNNYRLSKENFSDYLPDWFRISKLAYVNQSNDLIINDKIIFHKYFKDDKRIVPVRAYVYDGRIYDGLTDKIITLEELFEADEANLIFKTARGGGGSGITKISNSEKDRKLSLIKARELLSKNHNFIIQDEIKQEGFAHEVYPLTLNTIRILTIKDTESGLPYIAKAVHRFGTSQSHFVDNWTSGGICVDIDISKKVFGRGAIKGNKSENLVFLDEHPDTKVRFAGENVPNWDLIQEEILQISKQLFFLKYIGWDIIPFEDGFQILEANSNTDVNLLQIHGGLLRDQKVKRFYKKEGL